ncbi:hypothetical protein AX16_003680 [Volvariella volvacea WC 439]|nr:hypothetical protein AX16_003680 [Volvariella volvacea WC 439]
MSASEEQQLLPAHTHQFCGTPQSELRSNETIRAKAQQTLESPATHILVILLVGCSPECAMPGLVDGSQSTIDAICVFSGIAYLFLTPGCEPDPELPLWLKVLDHISLTITSVFLVEIPINLWAFGLNYFNPLGYKVYGLLHIFDAFIIVTTFTLEVGLKGREGELAGLLIIFRLWRLVKLIGGLAAGAGEISEEQAQALDEAKKEVEILRTQVIMVENENILLRQRLQL